MNGLCVVTYLAQDILGATHQNIGHNGLLVPFAVGKGLTVPFFVLLWKKRNRSAKNGTVVQKHTVPFFVPLWKNGTVVQKTETVVQKHTVPFYVLLWKNGTEVQKTEQWYKNTLFRFLFRCVPLLRVLF